MVVSAVRSLLTRIFRPTPKTIRTPRSTGRTRLGVTALEGREMPAYITGGVLVIDGTDGTDNVAVSQTIPATWYEQAKVQVVHNGVTQTFSQSLIRGSAVHFNGKGGADSFACSAYLSVFADGGNGPDVLSGGPMDDVLIGGTNNDSVYGNGGNDQIWGLQGTDELRGGGGNDVLHGDGDADTMRGGPGDDVLYGDDGNDTIYGDNNAGTAGGVGNDTLYGGGGSDTLIGEGGNDGLFGGTGDGRDYLYGQAGADRLLMPAVRLTTWFVPYDAHEDSAPDLAADDARITFRNSPALTGQTFSGQDGEYSFNAGSWDNGQIQRVDVALANLHRHVGNTRLLKTAAGGETSFLAVGMQTDSNDFRTGGWNNGTEIVFVTPSARSNSGLERTVYHEFGHNWDDSTENPYADDFRSVSGWQASPWAIYGPGKVDDGYLPSTDAGATWEYLESADGTFARDYGRTNPFEDMGTTWEAYFVNRYHGGEAGLAAEGLNASLEKWATLDSLFGALRSE